MAKTVPDVAPRILERALERIKLRANSNAECFGGEIMESLREAGIDLGAHHVEILQTRSVLVRTMESLGEAYPAEILQVYDNRIQLSKALRFLNGTTRVGHTSVALWSRCYVVRECDCRVIQQIKHLSRNGIMREKIKQPRCPYCISGSEFKVMRVLQNGRQIGESCGHIVFPDEAFWCPCQNCLATRFSPRMQKHAAVER